MIALESMMSAKAARDAVRGAMVRELRRLGAALPSELTALLAADSEATSALAECLAGFEPIGALPNGGLTVELA